MIFGFPCAYVVKANSEPSGDTAGMLDVDL